MAVSRLKRIQLWWKYFWMTRAERQKLRAMHQLLSNVLAQAPVDKILRGESCIWSMTDDQAAGAKAGATAYADAARLGGGRE